uniref:Uncharacterized protein n=1 Tax=uncultured Choricystis TaxID=858337 RepID=A0A346HG40_9CHLO|nr:hypothetical protein [uncultured Choricystis]
MYFSVGKTLLRRDYHYSVELRTTPFLREPRLLFNVESANFWRKESIKPGIGRKTGIGLFKNKTSLEYESEFLSTENLIRKLEIIRHGEYSFDQSLGTQELTDKILPTFDRTNLFFGIYHRSRDHRNKIGMNFKFKSFLFEDRNTTDLTNLGQNTEIPITEKTTHFFRPNEFPLGSLSTSLKLNALEIEEPMSVFAWTLTRTL